jgi:hypothetical protein
LNLPACFEKAELNSSQASPARATEHKKLNNMETRTSFRQAHEENKVWSEEFKFLQQEMNTMEKHLSHTVSIRESKERADHAETLLNQVSRFRDMVAQMQNELETAETKMAIYAKGNQSIDLDAVNVGDHYQFRDKVERFKNEYRELRERYKDFENR